MVRIRVDVGGVERFDECPDAGGRAIGILICVQPDDSLFPCVALRLKPLRRGNRLIRLHVPVAGHKSVKKRNRKARALCCHSLSIIACGLFVDRNRGDACDLEDILFRPRHDNHIHGIANCKIAYRAVDANARP